VKIFVKIIAYINSKLVAGKSCTYRKWFW